METAAHSTLKLLAHAELARGGCAASAVETRCPLARFRVDVAGYLDPLPKQALQAALERGTPALAGVGGALPLERGPAARTVIVECKASRADFLIDSRNAERLMDERERLQRVKKVLEEQIIKACEPQLRRSGSALFADMEEWDFASSRVGSYKAVLRDLRRLDRQLHGESKFWLLAHYRLADYLVLCTVRGVVQARELPEGWGLLEFDPREVERADAQVSATWPSGTLRVAPPVLKGRAEHRARLLRNIAAASTREVFRARGNTEAAQARIPVIPLQTFAISGVRAHGGGVSETPCSNGVDALDAARSEPAMESTKPEP